MDAILITIRLMKGQSENQGFYITGEDEVSISAIVEKGDIDAFFEEIIPTTKEQCTKLFEMKEVTSG